MELKNILDKHLKWLRNESGGERANLSGANLSRRKPVRRKPVRRKPVRRKP